jgi:hypothetical protein
MCVSPSTLGKLKANVVVPPSYGKRLWSCLAQVNVSDGPSHLEILQISVVRAARRVDGTTGRRSFNGHSQNVLKKGRSGLSSAMERMALRGFTNLHVQGPDEGF